MKFLLDQGVPLGAADLLTARKLKSEHVSRLGMSRSSDAEILEYARDQSLVVITLDADFHTLLALSGAARPSVIRVREQGLDAKAFADVLMSVLPRIAESIEKGRNCLMPLWIDFCKPRHRPWLSPERAAARKDHLFRGFDHEKQTTRLAAASSRSA